MTTDTLLPIAPGYSPKFTAIPSPEGAKPVPGNLATWTSSDTVNAPVTLDPSDATGLTAAVAIPPDAVVGTIFVLSVSYTNASGVVATGTLSLTIEAPPAPPEIDITSFTITQTT